MPDQQTRVLADQPGITEFVPLSGVIHHITPLSLATFRAIELKAEELYPYPDKVPYMLPVENAADDTVREPAERNPEYVEICKGIDRERIVWRDWAVYLYCVKLPNYPTHEALIQKFAPQLSQLRKITTDLPEDDYKAIIQYIVLSGNKIGTAKDGGLIPTHSDYSTVLHLAIQQVPLTAAEVAEGMRFFRPKV